jgi:Trypsin
MRRLKLTASLLVVAVAAALAVFALPAAAITDGELDGDGHPYVGLMVAQDDQGNPLWRCTGTLMSDTVFMVAGHCTEAPAAHVEIWFDSGPIDLDENYVSKSAGGDGCDDAAVTGYPCIGDVGGMPYTHPQYNPNAFFLYDLGVVKLDGDGYEMSTYGALPELDSLDSLKKGTKNGAKFTSVGYGLQRAFPDAASWKDEAERVRMVSHPKLIQVNVKGQVGDFALTLSNNAKTGGTCFGDSGGPNFLESSNVVAGVTSYGKNWTCGGQGGVYRVDRADDLAWLATFGLTP